MRRYEKVRRLEDILFHFRNSADVLVLVGTKQKVGTTGKQWQQYEIGGWSVTDFGWRAKSQSHSGIVIAIRKKRAEAAKAVQIYVPPDNEAMIWGRFAALRLKTQASDVCIVATYPPPTSTPRSKG